ncbi:MAG: hypothetical protein LUO83_09395 [Methanothrix sp.]|nr:hypothetical protein [Methanothrix sp.]
MDYLSRLEEAKSMPDIFELVKSLVLKSMGKSRGGLMLGLANLGNNPQTFLGGFFATGSNVIVLNRIPLQRIKETRPEIFKPYVFHVLLHEYIHSLGFLDEAEVRSRVLALSREALVRSRVLALSREALGEKHLATMMAEDCGGFISYLAYPGLAWRGEDEKMELVEGFDRSSASYIA